MAFDPSSGFIAAHGATELENDQGPIFTVAPVELEFPIAADFVAAQVANDVLILALSNGRILRIDLNRPQDIGDIDLPKKPSEVGVIQRMFLDPTASHLLICTSIGENYYLHSQSKTPRQLARLRGVAIESVAWNPALPTTSTREILLGASDGNIYEVVIEMSDEFYKKQVKHLKNLHRLPDGPITGLWVDNLQGKADLRRVMIATQNRIFHLNGKIGHSNDGSGSIYSKLFEAEQPIIHEISRAVAGPHSGLVTSPDAPDDSYYDATASERAYAWLSSQGVYHGRLLCSPLDQTLGSKVFAESKMLPKSQIISSEPGGKRPSTSDVITDIALTQWHIIHLVGGRIVTTNRLTGQTISEHDVLGLNQTPIGLTVDLQKNTFWLCTSHEIYEIEVKDEARDIWKIMVELQQFETAMHHARSKLQRETISGAHGDYLAKKGNWQQAAITYGQSNRPFEDIALKLIDNQQPDALREFLLTKLSVTKKSAVMQRIMIASWLVEAFMGKLNALDDTVATQVEISGASGATESKKLLDDIRKDYRDFIVRYQNDLDHKTTYDVISSHGRETELLFFANTIKDYNFVLSYWVQRENWAAALDVLKKQTDPEVFYRYSTVILTNMPLETVEILMRHPDLKPRKLIPALLEYNRKASGEVITQNQAIRYLTYVVRQLNSKDAAIHNALISMYASHSSKDESGLLSYLQAQGDEPDYDPDFALRQCIQHHRTLSCVHIYTSMGQYLQAVDLALSHDEIELAAVIADRPVSNPPLRKRLWLAVARKVIAQSSGIKAAIEFLKKCELLRIEDLIPFFPDFVVIDDFREEICDALEDYSRNIDNLKKEMDEASQTASNIKLDIAALSQRYAIVEPGERCYVCGLPLLSRQFFVFPCQHAFHSDCMGRKVLEQAGVGKSSRIKDLQLQIHKGLVNGPKRDAVVSELDSLVASACILCSDFAIKRIDEPFVIDGETDDWTL